MAFENNHQQKIKARSGAAFDVVAIATSAGGLSALSKVISGLPVGKLKEPVKQFLSDEIEEEKVSLEAINRRDQSIMCHVTWSIRCDSDGKLDGVILLMEAEQR